jgi:formylglycine-generating enzyme required for sulfatase activity
MGTDPSTYKGPDRPVEMVSWDDVREFCRKLTDRERAAGRLPSRFVYTLPTEAQWEYACRAGTTGRYAGELDDLGWYKFNSGDQTQPVSRKQPNDWGFYDMHGNVWEWCLDWKGSYPSGTVTDPTGPESGSGRVKRGGSYDNVAVGCRSTGRFALAPGVRYFDLGFRLALSADR